LPAVRAAWEGAAVQQQQQQLSCKGVEGKAEPGTAEEGWPKR
jgi:hypothetical protein